MIPRTALLASLLVLLPASASAELRLARIFGDHMVLQREAQAPLWGWADPGARVTVTPSWSRGRVSAVAGDDGRWQVALGTPAAGGPHSLVVTAGEERVELSDVLVGEVWICSGQSNMEWHVDWCADAEAEVAAAEHPALRLFTVSKRTALEPVTDVSGEWQVCSPRTAGAFSATGYYFGRELVRELGDVPIGLVSTNWGGTVSEAWTSRKGLADFPEFGPILERVASAAAGEEDEDPLAEQQASWWRALESADPGFAGAWMAPGADLGDWGRAAVPAMFADFELGGFDGCVWFRVDVELPPDWAGKELLVELGAIDDMDVCYWDGEFLGATRVPGRWREPRRYRLPAERARAGRAVLAVCALDTGGGGSLGRVADEVHGVRLVREVDGAQLDLAGEWRWRRGAAMGDLGGFPTGSWFHQNVGTALYNGMLAPLVPLAMRGAIWYQGESNRDRAAQYRRLFPALIADWRAQWGREFPFYWVQIAPFRYGGDSGQAAELREAQTLALALPETGMAVTMDIGNPADIHPRNKQEVGRRLALWALAQTYGRTGLVCSGPLYADHTREGSALRLEFRHARGGLATLDGAAPSHFVIAGADQVFHPAEARVEGEAIVVSSPAVPEPVAVRYAWGAADEPNLVGPTGLPAPSFRSDDWAPVSAWR